ncbi:RING-H2 finger protein ATL54-like [Cucumis melo var. makuwa]|uniref:RING-H2 finger protein ATL54-like n=2 Tax=Cucumis melo TaxID=3656 RepID=A0A5D3DSQ9_CUCMM|nr:RING-H2 finger protein ATL54-like [Cucumis melo var. makuwa]TYK26499.1 RING-H2 finger protein ATL54-like [Cucumis melo var. makuwa]
MNENQVDHPIWFVTIAGLQPSVINSITVCKNKKSECLIEGTDCSVCLSEFQEDEIAEGCSPIVMSRHSTVVSLKHSNMSRAAPMRVSRATSFRVDHSGEPSSNISNPSCPSSLASHKAQLFTEDQFVLDVPLSLSKTSFVLDVSLGSSKTRCKGRGRGRGKLANDKK